VKAPSRLVARLSGLTVVVAPLLVIASSVMTSCSIPDASRVTTVGGPNGPNEDLYKQYVDPYLARRCATLDCHGQVGRPLRLYSQLGLRQSDAGVIDPIDVTGFRGEPTTDAEKHANYEAVVGLQPEVMAQVAADLGAGSDRLLLLLKPQMLIPHKGGKIINQGQGNDNDTDPTTLGYDCINTWLGGGVLFNELDADHVGTLDPFLVSSCAEATSAP
jgi:hypothetical protein